jgi:hypothetical protein
MHELTRPLLTLAVLGLALGGLTACASGSTPATAAATPAGPAPLAFDAAGAQPPSPDPRVGLGAGLMNAEEAIWNLRKLSSTPPPADFIGVTNSDLAFAGPYAIQGNYNGFMVWDLTNPAAPELVTEYLCPASQSDVSVYRNLLFVSGEGFGGRVDCGTQGVEEAISADRLRGIRIFDISDIRNPEYIANVQTCRGSHTHTVLEHPGDTDNVYIYVSGSAPVRPAQELAGCATGTPDDDPNTALFRIEVIRVPLANPQAASIVSSPRIFDDLVAPPVHGPAPADLRAVEEARAAGAFIAEIMGEPMVLPDDFVAFLLSDLVEARGGSGAPTAADSAQLREALPGIIEQMMEAQGMGGDREGPFSGPTQCHDITVYPELGIAGGACEGYGLLLDIADPVNPVRIDAVYDENFAYWHSATFNNDGTMVLFTDEWGGGGQPKCRVDDPMEWGANAIFSIENGAMRFRGYWKLPAPQTEEENCVAHNGSIIPVPGRDIMVQAWYQGGVTVFDWTDPENVVEIAYHDRGPVNAQRMENGGSWSAYWYNGLIVSSEIARGLDVFELTPSPLLTRNEIDAALTARLDFLNPQGQPRFTWPPSFAKARALMDQLERSGGMDGGTLSGLREELAVAEGASGSARRSALAALGERINGAAGSSSDATRVRMLAEAVAELAG